MSDESVVALIKDLTAKLSAVAEEFSGRAERVDDRAPDTQGEGDRGRGRRSSLDMAQSLIDQRRIRRRFLPDDLFHEPAWDMLLALYIAWHANKVMNVKTLVSAADSPVTTSQRWIDHLAKLGLVTRVVDPTDRRRIEVTLSQAGLEAIDAYLRAIG